MAGLMPAGLLAAEIKISHPVGVVELFTSQGCSSCPRADAIIGQIADRSDVVTIAYHIDYWNYLGWQDTLSSKAFTNRQYAYAKTLGNSNVYTPQIVLNGEQDVKAGDATEVVDKLMSLKVGGKGLSVPINARLTATEMTIDIGDGTGTSPMSPGNIKNVPGKADVVIAYFKKKVVVDIARGENQGQKISYANAAVDMATVGMWDGKATTIKLPAAMFAREGYEGCAILLQSHDTSGNPGRILGAAALRVDL